MFLYVRGSPEGSPPCRGRRAWVPRRPLKLCQREHHLLVGPPKPDRSKGRGPTKRDPPVLQFRGLGTGITTLSRKTPMLRKRQKKKPPYVPHGIVGISEWVMLEDSTHLSHSRKHHEAYMFTRYTAFEIKLVLFLRSSIVYHVSLWQ